MSATFGALPDVHFLHSIYHFKLKRRSYSHCKQITPKCCEIRHLLREFRNIFSLALFFLLFHFSFLFLSSQPNSEDFSSEDERLGSLSLGVKDHLEWQVLVVHAILNTIAEEVMNFMSYVAKVSRGWDEPNARDMGK
ncbi:hypothetical protein AAG906_036964 [Vitis piasezkii]